MLRIAVIGIGNQGRHHLRLLKELSGVTVALLVDRDPEKVAAAPAEFQIPSYTSYADHLNDFDAAIIAVPTSDHFQIAVEMLSGGKHVLIEKPVASTIQQAEELREEADRRSLVAHVGFPERFNPAVTKALSQITRPLFVETHRLGIFSPRSLDIDVIMDLMIHDLDLLYFVLKEEPSYIEAVGIPVLSTNIDIANARLKFPGGCVVNLTASRVSAQKMRKMRLFQPYAYLSLDFAEQSFSMHTIEPNLCNAGFPEIRKGGFRPASQEHPLLKELEAFRDAVVDGRTGGITISDAIPSLKMALAIKQNFIRPEI
jgi:predicted dehydrogenase